MEAKFSQRVKDVLAFSREEALRLGNDYIGVEHLILGILREGEGLAIQILNYLGIDLNNFKKSIERSIVTNFKPGTKKLENGGNEIATISPKKSVTGKWRFSGMARE